MMQPRLSRPHAQRLEWLCEEFPVAQGQQACPFSFAGSWLRAVPLVRRLVRIWSLVGYRCAAADWTGQRPGVVAEEAAVWLPVSLGRAASLTVARDLPTTTQAAGIACTGSSTHHSLQKGQSSGHLVKPQLHTVADFAELASLVGSAKPRAGAERAAVAATLPLDTVRLGPGSWSGRLQVAESR